MPNIYTREAMLIELRMIVGDAFDFFYMPAADFNNENRRHAIVNFPQPLDAMKCISTFTGRKSSFVCGDDRQAYRVVAAKVQGLAANLESTFYELGGFNVPDKEYCAPLVMKEDKVIAFEEAVKAYCPEKYDMLKKMDLDQMTPLISPPLKKHLLTGPSVETLTTDDSCTEEEEDKLDSISLSGCSESSAGTSDYTDSDAGSSSCEDFDGCDPSVIDSFRARFASEPDNWSDVKKESGR